MARNEQVICDACKKTWDLVGPDKAHRSPTAVAVSYDFNGGWGGMDDSKKYSGELCNECSTFFSYILYSTIEALGGDLLLLDEITETIAKRRATRLTASITEA